MFDHIQPAQDQAERFARLRLSRTSRVGPVNFAQLMLRFGTAQRALEEIPNLVRRNGGALTPPPIDKVEAEMARGEAVGAHLLVMGDADYPPLLAQADAAPPILWTLGPLNISRRAIGMVGARNASAAGQKMAQMLAHDLGEAGFQIVSGMARGIDTRAHEMSLKTGTVAVLGGGVDDVYPPENQPLYERLRSEGLIVSESPVGHRAQAQDFPRRNRIISGLCLATIVVEAELRSGSLITARLAAEQNREVFAVPGSPLDPRAKGTNDLLRQGANLCENADDVLRVLEGQMGFSAPESPWRPYDKASGPAAEIDIERTSRRLLELISDTPSHRDDLLRLCGASVPVGLASLSELEISGRIQMTDGGFYTRL
ncbi:DNA-processing protein DprA [Asticcacaulis sp. EMRT-3]|uniref:DNA-processing protein DprA n=1 Tax=Asticcacaulis sp. EMRT-3 TaxID=3040349 RepID=UPI0024AEBA6F|nr:DNA-processing protein DprA [Asticcacaulis sp. EMRT-3]MDI7774128.1 DNA-processing protein DprA [Asticcacaulis sp. EMRT-3]